MRRLLHFWFDIDWLLLIGCFDQRNELGTNKSSKLTIEEIADVIDE